MQAATIKTKAQKKPTKLKLSLASLQCHQSSFTHTRSTLYNMCDLISLLATMATWVPKRTCTQLGE